MGVYDTISVEGREGQVKCFESTMRHLIIQSNVGGLNGVDTYCIAMREGGFVYVVLGRIVGWETKPLKGTPVFDKYGSPFTPETQGQFGGLEVEGQKMDDPYFFKV